MTYAIHHALGASVNSIHYEAYYDTGNITLTFIGLLCLLLARPSSAVGCRRWGCTDERLPLLPVFNTFHCLANITSFLYILFTILCPSFLRSASRPCSSYHGFQCFCWQSRIVHTLDMAKPL